MNIKRKLIHLIAKQSCKQLADKYKHGRQTQEEIFHQFIKKAKNTKFGIDHHFENIKTLSDYQSAVPVRDYEELSPYFERLKNAERDVFWPGLPKYFAKTSGTTSGSKFIPLTKDSIKNHIDSAKHCLFHYIKQEPDTGVFDGKMLFLSGSPELSYHNNIATGRLSGIINHEIPAWFQKNKIPDDKINRIEPWEQKIESLVRSLSNTDVRVVSGIPPWIQMFFESLLEFTGRSHVIDLFPNLELYIHGGVNYAPYKQKISQLIGKDIALLETYPASEGFIAYQDNYKEDGMQLVTNNGIFFEFIEKENVYSNPDKRLSINEIKTDTDYAIVLTTNAGLWSYLIGDLVRFISLEPYKIKFSGRISQFISAFGEHVISSEIDLAISMAQKKHRFDVIEFMVAPQVSPKDNRYAYHEWFIEFSEIPKNLHEIAQTINMHLCEINSYYKDLIEGKLLDTLKIRPVRKNGFLDYMRKVGKLGEQFKVHRLSNDRIVADVLIKETIKIN